MHEKVVLSSKKSDLEPSCETHPEPPSLSNSSPSSSSRFSLNDYLSQRIGKGVRTSEEISSLDQRIRSIQSQSRKDADEKVFNVIEYWAKKRFEDPEIWKLVQVVLGAAPTQCSVERDFSQYNLVFTKPRNRISGENLENVLKIRSNKSIMQKSLTMALSNDTE